LSGAAAEGGAVAVGVSSGIVSTGASANDILFALASPGLPEVSRTAAPDGTVLVRASRGFEVFVGREGELAALAGVDGGARVLVGLGGCGKSTLARRFALQRRESANPVWWIEGRSSGRIEAGLAEFAIRLAPVLAG
jgi:hypothetical protein